MPRRTSLSMPTQINEQQVKGMDALTSQVYGDELDLISVDDLDPPTHLCCGKDKLLCCSSKLHGSIFVVSIIFMFFYAGTSSCAWTFYALYIYIDDPFGLVFYLNVSLSLRLVLSVILLVASVTRRNCWLMIYIGGTFVALVLFCIGLSKPEPLLLLCAPIVIASDFIMFYIIQRFVVENQYFPVILAEKKQRYNTTIRRLLREAKKEDEYQAIKEGILKNAQASKETSSQKSIIVYPKTSRPRSVSTPGTGRKDTNISIDALLMQTNQRASKQVHITEPKKPTDWKQMFLKGSAKFWPTPWFKNKMADTGPATMPVFGMEGGRESILRNTKQSKDEQSTTSKVEEQTDSNKTDEKINTLKDEIQKDDNKIDEKSTTIKTETQKDSNTVENNTAATVEAHKAKAVAKSKAIKVKSQKAKTDEKNPAIKVETLKENKIDEKNPVVKVETLKENKIDEKNPVVKVETQKERIVEKNTAVKVDTIKEKKIDEKNTAVKVEAQKDNKDEKIVPNKVNTHKEEKVSKDAKVKPSVSTPSTTSKDK